MVSSSSSSSSSSLATTTPLPLTKKTKVKHARAGRETSMIECLREGNSELYTEEYIANLRNSYIKPLWGIFYSVICECTVIQIKEAIRAIDIEVNFLQKKHLVVKSILQAIEAKLKLPFDDKERVCNIALVMKPMIVESTSIEAGHLVFVNRTTGESEIYNNGFMSFSFKFNHSSESSNYTSKSVCIFSDTEVFTWKTCMSEVAHFKILFDKTWRAN